MKHKIYKVPTYIRDYSRKRQSDYIQDGVVTFNPCLLHFFEKEDERGENEICTKDYYLRIGSFSNSHVV